MNAYRTKSLDSLEEKMKSVDENSLRYHILESAKRFKTSWIDLGRALYSAWKDKLYKEWGYGDFNIYTTKEIGIRKQTALKLLKSYYFLEKEEPVYLEKEYTQNKEAPLIPSLEAVDVLRLAKNKKILDEEDYSNIKRQIFEKGTDAREVKKNLGVMIKERQELDPEEAWQQKKTAVVRRFLGTLKSLKREIEIGKLLPASLIREAAGLIDKLEEEIIK